ncbi:MAG: glycine cleavage T C-terminal barrel domain-containing protein, partial [Pseudomonadota bacterium]
PALERAEVKMLLNGPESFTPDGMFMLGETAETPGLYLGCGMNSVGIASGGGAGMNLAHLIARGRTAYDLSEADAKRFAPVFDRVEHLMARAPEILGTHYEIAYPGRQLRTARNLRPGPLDAEHAAAGAVTAQVAGFERPLHHGGASRNLTFQRPDWHDAVAAEALAAHLSVAVFDASPFGKIEVEGPDAEAFLGHVCAGFIARPPGAVIYTPMLNAQGGYESDLTALRLSHTRYRLLTGAAALRRDLAWLRRHAAPYDVRLADVTEAYALLPLMGPDAPALADALGAEGLRDIPWFRHATAKMAGVDIRAARLSYVGEPGWELTCRWQDAPALHRALTGAGARPAGLYAQTSMRIEKAFRAMGHELDADVTPVDAGLDAAIAGKRAFLGAEAVAAARAAPPRARIATLVFDDPDAVPLGHEPVRLDGRILGLATSAAFGHRIGRPVALAQISPPPPGGVRVQVDIAGAQADAVLGYAPAYDPDGVRMRADLSAAAAPA